MSRLKIQTAYLGAFTVAALDAAPDTEAAWLVHALCAWILRDELPAEIPPSCASAWAVIRSESEAIHAAKKQDAENGKGGGRPPKKPKETQTEPKKTQTAKTEPNRNQEREEEEEKEVDLIRNESETERAGKPASASASASVFTDLDSLDWFTLPERALVDRALALIGEEGNARMAGRLRKARRILGLPAFREVLATFDSELRAGEVPANKGATLNARLSAREAMS
jgi:hypothetical protein